MASSPRLRVIRPEDPAAPPLPGPLSVTLPPGAMPGSQMMDGALVTDQPDGGAEVDFNPDLNPKSEPDSNDFYANLASKINEADLQQIANDLLEGIDRDENDRKDWLNTRAMGIRLLGLKLEDPKSDIGSSSAPLEGMSSIRHPLLLEATVAFQANARGELLPASGPVKVRNDTTTAPPRPAPLPGQDPNQPGAQLLAVAANQPDELATALEKDLNHYLTAVATEYVPDTDRMLFYVGFGGDGFKKVFNCPLRRRPVSESVDAEDLIVSNACTDLRNSGRITHKIKMRKSVLRRMQLLGAYRDVELSQPAPEQNNAVEKEKAAIAGVTVSHRRPEDTDYTIYEVYCELDLDQFAPKQFKGEGLPLPYRVTIEKDSRQVLSVIRNWNEDDEQAHAKQFFVQFPYIRGLGFYGLGLVHLLGNTTSTLTAGWRETIDAGMFANFPGFLYNKSLGRQLSNQIRVPPGGGFGIDIGGSMRISDAVMPLPYREAGAGFTAFLQHVEDVGRRIGGIAETNVGEGKQEAPVGTTLALIEQATKPIAAVHKRLHAAQAEEFKLLKERFKEDPEAFWRHNSTPSLPWQREQFLKALNDNNIVPVADPNNPTSLHRVSKATIIKELQKGSPTLYNPQAVDMRVMRITGIDPEGLFNPVPAPEPPDPRLEAIKAKAEQAKAQREVSMLQEKIKAAAKAAELEDREKQRQSNEQIALMKLQLEDAKRQSDAFGDLCEVWNERQRLHQEQDIERERAANELQIERERSEQEAEIESERAVREAEIERAKSHIQMRADGRRAEHDLEASRQEHAQTMEHDRQRHAQDLQHAKELNKAKVAAARAMAKAKPKPKPSGGK